MENKYEANISIYFENSMRNCIFSIFVLINADHIIIASLRISEENILQIIQQTLKNCEKIEYSKHIYSFFSLLILTKWTDEENFIQSRSEFYSQIFVKWNFILTASRRFQTF